MLQYVTEITPAVTEIGAANTLEIEGDKVSAYNTDVIGFENSFVKKLKPDQKKALVLGTGGSSKAVQYVLRKLHIRFLVVSRSEHSTNGIINYPEINENIMNDHPVIINCTPAGMHPDIDQCPAIPYQLISEKHYLFDLIYRPEKTLFLQKGEEKGAVIENGYEMLMIQAEESWKIWNSH